MAMYLITCNFHVLASSPIEAELMILDQVHSKKKDDKYGIIGLNHFKPVELK